MARAGVITPEVEASAMYAGLGTGLLELLWLAGAAPRRRDEALGSQLVFDRDFIGALERACARGPVILAASHTANWELVAYGAARRFAKSEGRGLAVVVKPLSTRSVDRFCTRLRRACGLTLLAPAGAALAVKRRLRAGDIVAMPIDQVPGRAKHAVRVSFLGAGAFADRAPAALARANTATLIVAAASREGRAQRVHLLATLDPAQDRTPGADAWITHATREASLALERFVCRHPSAWLWLHRRWRAPLEASRSPSAGPLVATGHPG